MGIPEMQEYWNTLLSKSKNGSLKGKDKQVFKKLVKALKLLQNNPKHPGLQTHEIRLLSDRYGTRVWQS